MRTLTGTVEAAQREVSGQVPRVRLQVRDKQTRFVLVSGSGATDAQTASCLISGGVLVMALNKSGQIYQRIIAAPFTGEEGVAGSGHSAEWWGFTAEDALAWPNGDIALSNNSGTIRVFYVEHTGNRIMCRESTDDGASWGGALEVHSYSYGGASYFYWLASAGQNDLFWSYSRPGYRYILHHGYSGGVWSGAHQVGAGALFPNWREWDRCWGISVQYDSDESKFVVVGAFGGPQAAPRDGRILWLYYDSGTGNSSGGARIQPPGYGADGFLPKWPSLVKLSADVGGGWMLAYIDRFTGVTTWHEYVAIRSHDLEHWSYKIPIGFSVEQDNRPNLVELDEIVYCDNVDQVYSCTLWKAGRTAREVTIAHERVLRYRMQEWPDSGMLIVELDNRDGYFDSHGANGSAVEALGYLAKVSVEAGLVTSGGTERVEGRPFFLWGMSRVREEGKNWVRLYCPDGWRLLRMWRPDATFVFAGETIKHVIQEIVSRATFCEVEFDGSSGWDTVLTDIAFVGEQSGVGWRGGLGIRGWGRWKPIAGGGVVFGDEGNGFGILSRLLGLVGGLARWGNGSSIEVLYCMIPSEQGEDPAADHTYTEGEVLRGLYVESAGWPTRVRVTGEQGSHQESDLVGGLRAGMEFFSLLYSSEWEDTTALELVADSALADARARRAGGWIETRPNLGLEVLDVISVVDALAGGGLSAFKRRVNGIETEYVPLEGRWVQKVHIEGL